jgi:predicted CoA-binding protein
MIVDLRDILAKYKTVAIVGLSKDPSKDSYRVAMYLKSQSFRIMPINPFANEKFWRKKL